MSKWEMERDIERLESRLENANEDCKAALETVDALRADLADAEERCRRMEEALRSFRSLALAVERHCNEGDLVWAKNTAAGLAEEVDLYLAPPPEAEKRGEG